jgi:superfamily I DNA/RNA helicase
MDATEVGRQRAAELHRLAVEAGRDPWRPLEFVLLELASRGLTAEAAVPGAAQLDRGRAVYLPDDGLVLYEGVPSEFERAFLIAHELGHIELGDGETAQSAIDVDLARTSEPAPVGFDRVVDYGRRQRREVQMDLFAREFLLPRPVARKLHAEDGATASDISKRLGAPFDVVAQQLFDALLMPPVVMAQMAESVERSLNPLQREAATHRGKAYLLEAGPGTGKTQTLIARVEGLLDEGVDPRRILLLTFSNKAAGEMAERIAAKRTDAAAAMWIGTFHAFGLDIIRRFYVELCLPPNPRMLDRTEAVELLEEEFPRLALLHYRNLYDPTQTIADLLNAISRAKDEVVDASDYMALATAMKTAAQSSGDQVKLLAADKALEVALFFEVYEGLKHQAQAVDFGDLVSLPVSLLENNASVRQHLSELYDHVLVDEYQDVNRSSVRLLQALCGDGDNLWAVGDARQSIYRFRGASSFNLTRFGKEDFPSGVRGRLERNYRSVSEIVEVFSTFAIGMAAGSSDSSLESNRGPSGDAPEFITANRAQEQSVAVADSIEAMVSAGHRYRDQAVLCSGNDRLSALGQDLERLGTPVLFLGSLFERPEVKDLLAFLSVLVDRRAMGLVRLACWPEFAMPLADVGAALDHLRSPETVSKDWLQDPVSIAGLSSNGEVSLQTLRVALEGFDETSPPWKVLATLLLDRTRMAARIGSSTSVTGRAQGIAIWQFMNFLRSQPPGKGLPVVRLMGRIRRLLRLSDERDLRQLPAAAQGIDAVRLMTVHGSKGLEFSVVHLPGMNSGTLPRTAEKEDCPPPEGMVQGGLGSSAALLKAAHDEEQECIFYVALSRARDRLRLYAATHDKANRQRGFSPFIDRISQSLDRSHAHPNRTLPPASEDLRITLAIEGGLNFSGQQIALYEKCPRRFFYTHVLQVGGRRKTTAFMQMHEAVRTVINDVVNGSKSIDEEETLRLHVKEAFTLHGLGDHGYVEHYENIAVSMVQFFHSTRTGRKVEPPMALSLPFGSEQIIVLPDEVILHPDGRRTLRRVQTGHRRSIEGKDTGAAAFVLAARKVFPDATVELVHLSDQSIHEVELSATLLQSRQTKLGEILGQVRDGQYPAVTSSRTCPNCPAFFVCCAVSDGPLPRTFSREKAKLARVESLLTTTSSM